MYIYIYVHMYIHIKGYVEKWQAWRHRFEILIHEHIHTYMYLYTYVYMYICVCVCVYIYISIYMYMYICIRVCIHICTYIRIYKRWCRKMACAGTDYIYIHIYVFICIYLHATMCYPALGCSTLWVIGSLGIHTCVFESKYRIQPALRLMWCMLQCATTRCNTLQHAATLLQHTATHCNTPQRTATHCNKLEATCSVPAVKQVDSRMSMTQNPNRTVLPPEQVRDSTHMFHELSHPHIKKLIL